MSSTQAGEALFDRMEPLLRDMEEGLEEARSARREATGTVRIHAFRLAATLHLAPILRRFTENHPHVTIDITLEDAVTDPVAAGFDAAIRLGEFVEKDMVAIPVGGKLRQFVVAAPSDVRDHGVPAIPHDLAFHQCILWQWPGHSST